MNNSTIPPKSITEKKKGVLQKMALFFAYASFVSSVVCVIYLFFKIDDLGWQSPISASLLAATFFFIFVAWFY